MFEIVVKHNPTFRHYLLYFERGSTEQQDMGAADMMWGMYEVFPKAVLTTEYFSEEELKRPDVQAKLAPSWPI